MSLSGPNCEWDLSERWEWYWTISPSCEDHFVTILWNEFWKRAEDYCDGPQSARWNAVVPPAGLSTGTSFKLEFSDQILKMQDVWWYLASLCFLRMIMYYLSFTVLSLYDGTRWVVTETAKYGFNKTGYDRRELIFCIFFAWTTLIWTHFFFAALYIWHEGLRRLILGGLPKG